MRKQYIYAILIFLIYLCYKLYIFHVPEVKNCNEYFALVFGTIEFSQEDQFIWNSILWLFPQIPLIILYSDYFERTLKPNFTILVCRQDSKPKIMIYTLWGLLKRSMIFISAQILLSWITALFCNAPVWKLDIFAFLEIINFILYLLFLIIVLNIFSLIASNIFVVLMVLISEWIQLFLIKNDIKWVRYLPVQGALQQLRLNSSITAPVVSIGILLIWIVSVVMIGVFLFQRKKDFL